MTYTFPPKIFISFNNILLKYTLILFKDCVIINNGNFKDKGVFLK